MPLFDLDGSHLHYTREVPFKLEKRGAHPDILHILSSLGISYEMQEHRAIFSERDGAGVEITLPGTEVKNLFVRDKGGRYALVSMALHRRADLGKIARRLGTGRLSFCSADELWRLLHITPGSVSPLCVMFDTDCRVRLLFDKNLEGGRVIVHPLRNTASVSISFDDLKRFVRRCGHEVLTADVYRDEAD